MPDGDWSPIVPSDRVPLPERVVFIDGVRRLEARAQVRQDEHLIYGGFGSYAVGAAVICDSAADFGDIRVFRSFVLGSGRCPPSPVRVHDNLEYRAESTPRTEDKEQQGTARPLVFVVLDELNKYAPRSGWSPIQDVVLDIAERGRSLGVSLFGAQQTASEVERRVVANAALKVVGRLDAAEAERGEYGFLTQVARKRATMLSPGTMIVTQPELPTPILLNFPFPPGQRGRAK